MLLLEYGGSDRSVWIQMPSALSIPMNMERYDWRYYTEPEPNLNNRRLHTPRGKVLGGSSSINGLVYVRGNAQDFERWESAGCQRLGRMRTCCLTSAVPSSAPAAGMSTAATRASLPPARGFSPTHCTQRGCRRGAKRATRSART